MCILAAPAFQVNIAYASAYLWDLHTACLLPLYKLLTYMNISISLYRLRPRDSWVGGPPLRYRIPCLTLRYHPSPQYLSRLPQG